MKLIRKWMIALVIAISVVLTVNGVLRVRREVALFESDRVHNQQIVSHALSSAASAIARTDGDWRARQMLEQVGQRTPSLRISWLTSESAVSDLGVLEPEDTLTRITHDRNRCTYALMGPGASGILSVCEPLDVQDRYVRRTEIETLVTTLSLVAVCAILSLLLGVWLVGNPVRALTQKARRIGKGDFSTPLRFTQHDELGALAKEMNAMCERLTIATERVAAETASRVAAIEQLRHADRLMTVGKLASGLAHELGTPLNVIEARAEMIVAGEVAPGDNVLFAKAIMQASERMTRILRQLLDFARTRSTATAPHEIVTLVKRTADLLAPLATKKNIHFSIVESTPKALAEVEPDQIQQVFANLMVNAVHATATPSTIEVDVANVQAKPPADHGGETGDYVRVSVRDHGSGIAPDLVPRVFEPFFTTKDVGEGTGLGLAVAYGIVRDHGGWIEVKSELGKGSEFDVFLRKGTA